MSKDTSTLHGAHTWNTPDLDTMVLELFKNWEHLEWFWRDDNGDRTMDKLLKSSLMRTTQILRAKHEYEPMLSWLDVEQPRTLFAATMVIGGAVSDAQQTQLAGLFPGLAAHWSTKTIEQAFSWMRSDVHDESWTRCVAQAKAHGIVLTKEPFQLFEHLSQQLQQALLLHQSVGLRPSSASLEKILSKDALLSDSIPIGPFL